MGYHIAFFLKWSLPPENTLYINCPSIGAAAHFEHNYSTFLNADIIGSDFKCFHLVTLGANKGGRPSIGNNVSVYTGSSIFGKIKVGNNVIVGAGTIVNKDVPDNCTIVGNPARIVKLNGLTVDIKL